MVQLPIVGSKLSASRSQHVHRSVVRITLGISLRAYSKIESGETALTTERLQQIARVLGIEPDEIIAFSEQNIYRSCQRCPYHQLPPITDLSFFTERLLYQQRIRELEQRVANLSKDI
jgi:transcriptional regulator with XRE-family HTH domain